MNRADSELSLDGGDQRRPLEESACEGVERARERRRVGQLIVQSEHTNVFLSCEIDE